MTVHRPSGEMAGEASEVTFFQRILSLRAGDSRVAKGGGGPFVGQRRPLGPAEPSAMRTPDLRAGRLHTIPSARRARGALSTSNQARTGRFVTGNVPSVPTFPVPHEWRGVRPPMARHSGCAQNPTGPSGSGHKKWGEARDSSRPQTHPGGFDTRCVSS